MLSPPRSLTGCLFVAAWLAAPALAQELPRGLYARVHTAGDDFVIELDPHRAPLTVAAFVGLAEGTIANAAFPPGRPYFDGSRFHRVVPGHVIQGGAPASESADGPGFSLPNEIHEELGHGAAGRVGIANAGPHTGGSQFYVTLGDRSYLDGNYTVFGRVASGMDVVLAVGPDDAIDSVRIERVGSDASAYRVSDASFRALLERVSARVALEEEARAKAVEHWVTRRWPGLDARDDGTRQLVLREGLGDTDPPVRARYRGERYRDDDFASREDGSPDFAPAWGDAGASGGAVFEVSQDEGALPAAVARVLESMRPGEVRLVVVPAELGYGIRGFYQPPREGTPRFNISPNTLLVYTVERVGR